MLDKFDKKVLEQLKFFLKEINKREVLIQEGKKDSYKEPHPALQIDVMYWHPNRTRHDEVDWLMKYVFHPDVTFTNKILNSFAVKFYGPSQAVLNAIGREEYSTRNLIDFDRLPEDKDYMREIDANLIAAKEAGKQQWGTTELRTSLQTAAKHHAGHSRTSNMIEWIASFKTDGLIKFYEGGPSMEQAFNKITSYRGIGNYYGYHSNSNLARCFDIAMNENEDFVVAGPGASATLDRLWPDHKKHKVSYQDMLLYMRDHQDQIFEHDKIDHKALTQTLKPGQNVDFLTSFGCEITSCQFNVFTRFVENPDLIERRKLEVNKEKKKVKEAPEPISNLLEF
jgi:hypothetical protein